MTSEVIRAAMTEYQSVVAEQMAKADSQYAREAMAFGAAVKGSIMLYEIAAQLAELNELMRERGR